MATIYFISHFFWQRLAFVVVVMRDKIKTDIINKFSFFHFFVVVVVFFSIHYAPNDKSRSTIMEMQKKGKKINQRNRCIYIQCIYNHHR